jgi:hypothetical protein
VGPLSGKARIIISQGCNSELTGVHRMDAEIPKHASAENDQELLTDLQREQVKVLSQGFYDEHDGETPDSVILGSKWDRPKKWIAFKIKYPWVAFQIEKVVEEFSNIDKIFVNEFELQIEKFDDPFSYLIGNHAYRVDGDWRRNYNVLLSAGPSRVMFIDTVQDLNIHIRKSNEYWNESETLIKAKMSHLSKPIALLQESLERIGSTIEFLNERHALVRKLQSIYEKERKAQNGMLPQ